MSKINNKYRIMFLMMIIISMYNYIYIDILYNMNH